MREADGSICQSMPPEERSFLFLPLSGHPGLSAGTECKGMHSDTAGAEEHFGSLLSETAERTL